MLVGAKPRALRPRAARSELVPNTRVLARSTGARASSRPPRRPAWRASRRPYPRVIQLDDFETANHQPFRDHRAIDRVGVDAQDFGAKGGASEAGLMKRRFLWCEARCVPGVSSAERWLEASWEESISAAPHPSKRSRRKSGIAVPVGSGKLRAG